QEQFAVSAPDHEEVAQHAYLRAHVHVLLAVARTQRVHGQRKAASLTLEYFASKADTHGQRQIEAVGVQTRAVALVVSAVIGVDVYGNEKVVTRHLHPRPEIRDRRSQPDAAERRLEHGPDVHGHAAR